LYTSPNVIRVSRLRKKSLVVYVAGMGEMRCVYKILIGKREEKRPRGRHRCKRGDNIRMDFLGCKMAGA
jgi:hypothetical protein